MPRMRTIDQAFVHIQEQDNETALTKTALRRLVVTGALTSVRVGAKYLLDLDSIEELLMLGDTRTANPTENYGIRKVI